MPTIKSNTKGVDRTIVDRFAPYDGAAPTPGFYTAVLQSAKMVKSGQGNLYISSVFKLQANKKDHPTKAQFNGYPVFDRTTIGEHEQLKARLANYLVALTGQDDAEIDYEELDEGGAIKRLGRKKFDSLVGKEVRVLLKYETYNGEQRISCDGVRPWEPALGVSGTVAQNASAAKPATSQPAATEDEDEGEADTEAYEETDAEDAWDRDAREEELKEASLVELKGILKEYELEAKGGKPKLIAAILDHEEEMEAEGDELPAEDEEFDEEALREELAALSLAELRGRSGMKGPKAKLIEAIVEAERPSAEDSDMAEAAELTEDSDIEDLIAALTSIDGYEAEDYEGYGENEREELVEALTEEGVLGGEADPF